MLALKHGGRPPPPLRRSPLAPRRRRPAVAVIGCAASSSSSSSENSSNSGSAPAPSPAPPTLLQRDALERLFEGASDGGGRGGGGGNSDGDASRHSLLLPALWPRLAHLHGDRVALDDPRAPQDEEEDEAPALKPPGRRRRGVSLTFRQLDAQIALFSSGLAALGVRGGDRVALFAEGSPRWVVADQAVMRLGAADAVRGASAPAEELAYIFGHSRAKGVLCQDEAAFLRAAPALAAAPAAPAFVVLLWGGRGRQGDDAEAKAAASLGLRPGVTLLTYRELLALGEGQGGGGGGRGDDKDNDDNAPSSSSSPPPPPPSSIPSPDTLATIVYTSGTTGAKPKGCPLTHSNLAYQLASLPPRIGVAPGDVSLSLLPYWHVFARVAGYVVLASGGTERFTTPLHLRDDLAAVRPAFLVAVPLLLEALHARVAARLKAAGRLRAVVASFLIRASEAYVLAQRRARGVDLSSALPMTTTPTPTPTLLSSFRSSVAAAATAFAAAALALALLPLHLLARLLVWKQVRQALGVTKAVVSGGASLPPHLDVFFEAAGIQLTSGWGLSETSPVLTCRSAVAAIGGGGGGGGGGGATEEHEQGDENDNNNSPNNVRGTVGRPLPGTELRVVDPETLLPVPPGEKGLILARGPGVFDGYLDDPEATAAAFPRLPDDDDGRRWFSTGDLGFIVPSCSSSSGGGGLGKNNNNESKNNDNKMAGCVVLSGRAKDTIVLSSGENVEPEPVEAALAVSPLVKQALVVGQDRRELGAVVFASEEAEQRAVVVGNDAVAREIAAELAKLNSTRPGYRAWEHLARVEVAWGAVLSPDDGTLTRTYKLRRAAVAARYGEVVAEVLAHLRGGD
jgi:long-chain acyl-CoA synthetase